MYRKLFKLGILTAMSSVLATEQFLPHLEIYTGGYNVLRSENYFMVGLNYTLKQYDYFSVETGGFISDKDMYYLHIGPRFTYKRFFASIGPGYYHQGQGLDLGRDLELKSEVGLKITKNLHVGFFHLSNAGTDDYNPGTEAAYIGFSGF